MDQPVHAAGSLALGLSVGLVVGVLFAPDPTGLLPFALAAAVAGPVAGYLYWGVLTPGQPRLRPWGAVDHPSDGGLTGENYPEESDDE